MKTLLCCIARIENEYIKEYVDYYKSLGVTNICLYDNNFDGEEDFRDVIGDDIANGFVILKDWRNKKYAQLAAYQDCYNTYKNDYDWFLFFDIDEFLVLHNIKTLNQYLTLEEFNEYDMIHVNWFNFGDGGQSKSDGRGVLQRITTPLDINLKTTYNFPDNFHIKSIVRGGLNEVLWMRTPHTPERVLKCCNGSGVKCDGVSPFAPYDFRKACLLHFTTKTAKEYSEKLKKGCADVPRDKELLIQLFFARNEPTEEKIKIFLDDHNIDMSYLLPSKYNGEKRTDVQIFSLCYAHKKFPFLNDAVITPLQVGAACGLNVCSLKDNVGDNISSGNYFYIENTGTYWIWKNVKDAKYKGQMQYRRPLTGINESFNFDETFEKYDVITCEPFHHPSHKTPTEDEPMVIIADTVEEGYGFSNCIDDLYVLEMAVKMYYPDYAEDYDKYIKNGPNLYYSNGFIMRSEDYDRYSEFLFNCLNGYLKLTDIKSEQELISHVKYNMEVGKYPRYADGKNVPPEAVKWQCSIGGFLSERLWTLWVLHNFDEDRILKLPYIKMEDKMYT